MTGFEINRVLQDVHRITVAAGLTAEDAAELYIRGLISAALVLTGDKREDAGGLLEQWCEMARDILVDPTLRVTKAKNGPGLH